MKPTLEELIETMRLRDASLTSEQRTAERSAQTRSFAYGNVHLSNPSVTREMIDKAADELENGEQKAVKYPTPVPDSPFKALGLHWWNCKHMWTSGRCAKCHLTRPFAPAPERGEQKP